MPLILALGLVSLILGDVVWIVIGYELQTNVTPIIIILDVVGLIFGLIFLVGALASGLTEKQLQGVGLFLTVVGIAVAMIPLLLSLPIG